MDIPVSRQLPAPSSPPPARPPNPRPKQPEPDDDYPADRLGAAAGEEIREDEDPTTHYATD